MNDLNTELLRNYATYLERRFGRLEAKELNAPEPRRARQMEAYLIELEAVLGLVDQIESEAE